MQLAVPALMLMSVLFPTKLWFAPDQALNINVKPQAGGVTLVLTDFAGRELGMEGSADVIGEKTIDARNIFPQLAAPGTYVLYAVPQGKTSHQDFVGTPLVIQVRQDSRRGAPPGAMVIKVEPLRYAVMKTESGEITMAFYYDVAPHTVANFLNLAAEGYYNGLTFHRIIPQFVIQGGDPRGDGSGGPGYSIDAEFNDRPHEEGVLSMARSGDPNSAGSQFFICLNYAQTKQLDNKYTAFGKVTDGMDAVKAIANTPLNGERPAQPQVIQNVEVRSVTPGQNPYPKLIAEQVAPGRE